MVSRRPQPVHAGSPAASPAPGDLELVRSWLSLHDHDADSGATLEPEDAALRWWLADEDLVPAADADDADLAWALRIRSALVSSVRENMGEPQDTAAIDVLNEAADEAGLQICFGDKRIHASGAGVRGAVARLLGISLLAQLDGTWSKFRMCADPNCTTVFYDTSRNHSGKWCSMQACGNRNKVRRFREREGTAVPG